MATGNLLNAYQVLKNELGRTPDATDLEAVALVHNALLCASDKSQPDIEKLTYDQLNTLNLSLKELVKLAELVNSKRVLLQSLHKVTTSLLIGQNKDAQKHQLEMADKAWMTVLTWLNGQSLQPAPKGEVNKPGLITETGPGESIRTLSGGLPTLGRRK